MVIQLMEAGDLTLYPDAPRFIIGVKGTGLRVAAAGADVVVTLLRQVDMAALAGRQLTKTKA